MEKFQELIQDFYTKNKNEISKEESNASSIYHWALDIIVYFQEEASLTPHMMATNCKQLNAHTRELEGHLEK